ncbi:MerR HTH family regulatory protein [Aliiroseovarius halocynthiae]|uniref:MerR family transcriptional regulator n=1 Tax=Aliiroseovarius halocynthiae TaxID=985055 RepID=UPI001FEA1A8E|nr:MerR family transcriptional regulator [Aliiroseovarius halocynthiae]SMR72939.1 MerR HTH family regulatory protein [Aliiroseovarius halocynthiae]
MDKKSPDAFRTISEVADWLGVPTHVLRFWESRFTQVKPVKRAGGRRYYRPADMELLGGIRKLLHEDGMTIRGVQKLLREHGIKHVAAMSPPLNSDEMREEAETNVVLLTSQDAEEQEEAPPAEIATEHETAFRDQMGVNNPGPETPDEFVELSGEETAANPASQEELSPPVRPEASDAAEEPATEPDLFSTSYEAELEVTEETTPQHTLALSASDPEPYEQEADVISDAPKSEAHELVATQGTKQTEPEPTSEETAEDLTAAAPAPIDVSHVAPDAADDAISVASNAMPSVQLRSFRASGGTLSEDVLRDLADRLVQLASRMPAAPAANQVDNG